MFLAVGRPTKHSFSKKRIDNFEKKNVHANVSKRSMKIFWYFNTTRRCRFQFLAKYSFYLNSPYYIKIYRIYIYREFYIYIQKLHLHLEKNLYSAREKISFAETIVCAYSKQIIWKSIAKADFLIGRFWNNIF